MCDSFSLSVSVFEFEVSQNYPFCGRVAPVLSWSVSSAKKHGTDTATLTLEARRTVRKAHRVLGRPSFNDVLCVQRQAVHSDQWKHLARGLGVLVGSEVALSGVCVCRNDVQNHVTKDLVQSYVEVWLTTMTCQRLWWRRNRILNFRCEKLDERPQYWELRGMLCRMTRRSFR